MSSSARSVSGSRIASRCGYSALRWPLRLSIQAWSVGVPGRPKCCAIAHRAMNSRVDPEVICGGVVGDDEQDRAGLVIDAQVDGAVAAAGVDPLEQPLGFEGVGERDLDLGRGLLDRGDRG